MKMFIVRVLLTGMIIYKIYEDTESVWMVAFLILIIIFTESVSLLMRYVYKRVEKLEDKQ